MPLNAVFDRPEVRVVERLKVELPRDLTERVAVAARTIGATPHAYIGSLLAQYVPALPDGTARPLEEGLSALVTYLDTLPAVSVMSSGKQGSLWWVKLEIAIDSPHAWNVVQELGFVLNYISLGELLPTLFKPVSPPPYLNGGPKENLAWVIESTQPLVDPRTILGFLNERLPDPTKPSDWLIESNENQE